MSDLNRYEIFVLVATLGSVTGAANELQMTKAAISKQIKRLETDFNITLFIRKKQRLVLTTHGELILEQAKKLIDQLRLTRDACRHFNKTPEGNLHVVVFSYFAQKLVFPKLEQFLDKYDKIKLRIDTTEAVPDFVNDKIDVAVGFSLPVLNPHEVVQKRMAKTRYILCASPKYFKKMGKPSQLSELHQHRYIEHASRKAMKLKKGFEIALQPYLVVNTVSSMLECALSNLGIIQLPLYMVNEYLKSGQLIEILPTFQARDASVYYHYLKTPYLSLKIKTFLDYFISNEIMDI